MSNKDKPRPCAGDWRESEIVGVCPWDGETHLPFPQQPVNSFSNLAYPLAGLITWWVNGSPGSLVFCLAMIALGIGSFAYHAWPTVRTAAFDHAGMYATFLALVFYAVGPDTWIIPALAAAAGAWVFRYAFSFHLNSMMGLFLLIALAASLRAGNSLGWVSLGFFALAMGAWQLDRRRLLLGRWGHGLWHVLTAAAFSLMFNGVN